MDRITIEGKATTGLDPNRSQGMEVAGDDQRPALLLGTERREQPLVLFPPTELPQVFSAAFVDLDRLDQRSVACEQVAIPLTPFARGEAHRMGWEVDQMSRVLTSCLVQEPGFDGARDEAGALEEAEVSAAVVEEAGEEVAVSDAAEMCRMMPSIMGKSQ